MFSYKINFIWAKNLTWECTHFGPLLVPIPKRHLVTFSILRYTTIIQFSHTRISIFSEHNLTDAIFKFFNEFWGPPSPSNLQCHMGVVLSWICI